MLIGSVEIYDINDKLLHISASNDLLQGAVHITKTSN
jgi:hypothetical protein